MKDRRVLVINMIWLFLGIGLNVACFNGMLEDYWGALGTGLIAASAIQLIRYARYKINDTYREKVDIQVSDERNQYISNKAWAWAGYLFVLVAAVLTVVFQIMGQKTLCVAASGAICLLIIFYWVWFLFLQKKY